MSSQFTVHAAPSRRYPTPNFATFTPPISLPFPPTIKAADIVDRRNSSQLTMKSPNAFFIYRKAFLDHLSNTYQDLKMTDVSKLVGICWRNEPEIVKDGSSGKIQKSMNSHHEDKEEKEPKKKRPLANFKLTTPDYSSQQYVFYEFIPNSSDQTSDSTSDPTSDSTFDPTSDSISNPTPDISPLTSPTIKDTSPFFTNPITDVAYETTGHDVSYQNKFNEDREISPMTECVGLSEVIFNGHEYPNSFYDVYIQQQNEFYSQEFP
ncbi:7265_t:CDS:2 [Racocetra fulgida]|uniref:7265_t:CDS:1 n=1 Tax=Racocetra fulgida TaxID=60492 RepID=A0A9N9DNJ6_9GLOM|nr:7265_t:CDS:2 [Racocetra fulgida]